MVAISRCYLSLLRRLEYVIRNSIYLEIYSDVVSKWNGRIFIEDLIFCSSFYDGLKLLGVLLGATLELTDQELLGEKLFQKRFSWFSYPRKKFIQTTPKSDITLHLSPQNLKTQEQISARDSRDSLLNW